MNNLIDYLEFRAKFKPNSLAIYRPDYPLTHLQLLISIKKIAKKLRTIGVRPGNLVVTCLADQYLDWLFILALLHEGAVSCSNHSYSDPGGNLVPDWMIADQVLAPPLSGIQIQIDQEWVNAAMKESIYDCAAHSHVSPEAVIRIVLTSGTTGSKKAVVLHAGQIESRAKTYRAQWSSYGIEHNMMRLSTSGGFNVALGNLMAGVPLWVNASPELLYDAILEDQIHFLAGSPTQLATFVQAAQKKDKPISCLKALRYGGGGLSDKLLGQLKELADGVDIIGAYSSTETGNSCAHLHSTALPLKGIAGFPLPGTMVQVVDEEGISLPPGEEGFLRIKTAYMASEYVDNPEASQKAFKDGWFYPGDVGHIRRNGLVMIAGRSNEVINCGGVKVSLIDLDQFLLNQTGVLDAASFGYEGEEGLLKIGVGLVADSKLEISALKKKLLIQFGRVRTPSLFVQLKEIPRNSNGKIMRDTLAQLSAKKNPK